MKRPGFKIFVSFYVPAKNFTHGRRQTGFPEGLGRQIVLAIRRLFHYNEGKWRKKRGITMICSVKTLGISGIQGSLVTAECFISNGLPGFDIVGLPDAAVKEAGSEFGRRLKAAA